MVSETFVSGVIMAPSQANRLDALEETVHELRESLPSIQHSLEERIRDMVALHEESIWKSKEDSNRNHEDLKSSLAKLADDVKSLMATKHPEAVTAPTPQS